MLCCLSMFQVVELLLSKGANKEHRNVSDYTPLSLAASGGFVNIIKLLLSHGAEINSRYCIYRSYSFCQSNIEIIARLIKTGHEVLVLISKLSSKGSGLSESQVYYFR